MIKPELTQHPITAEYALVWCGNCEQDQPIFSSFPGDQWPECAVCETPNPINLCDWEECFSKWGQLDGDGLDYTEEIADFLRSIGYLVKTHQWGVHNYVIRDITASSGVVLQRWSEEPFINPHTIDSDPRTYLPAGLVEILDSKFKPDTYHHIPVKWVNERPRINEVDDSDVYTIREFLVLTGESYLVKARSEEEATAKVGALVCGDPCPCEVKNCDCVEDNETRTEVIS